MSVTGTSSSSEAWLAGSEAWLAVSTSMVAVDVPMAQAEEAASLEQGRNNRIESLRSEKEQTRPLQLTAAELEMLRCHIQKDQVRSNSAQPHWGSASISMKAGALQSQPPAQVVTDQMTPGKALQSCPTLQNTHSLSSSGATISTSHLGSSSTLIC